MGLWQGIWQTKALAGIDRTDKRVIVAICSELKHKWFHPQCALLHIPTTPLLALGSRPPGTVLAKYVVQHSLMLKQRETNDIDGCFGAGRELGYRLMPTDASQNTKPAGIKNGAPRKNIKRRPSC
jgi:hypothetical protein